MAAGFAAGSAKHMIGGGPVESGVIQTADAAAPAADVTTHAHFDAWRRGLASGDLVFRARRGGWGAMGTQLSDRDRRFGHVGVAISEADGMFVVHAAGDPLLPEGRVRKDPLDTFLDRAVRVGSYRLPMDAGDTFRFVGGIADYHARGVAFDRTYSLARAEAVYCTELVWRVWADVVKSDPVEERTMWRGKRVIALDDLQYAPGVVETGVIDMDGRPVEVTVSPPRKALTDRLDYAQATR